jgi:hypothetical protein
MTENCMLEARIPNFVQQFNNYWVESTTIHLRRLMVIFEVIQQARNTEFVLRKGQETKI